MCVDQLWQHSPHSQGAAPQLWPKYCNTGTRSERIGPTGHLDETACIVRLDVVRQTSRGLATGGRKRPRAKATRGRRRQQLKGDQFVADGEALGADPEGACPAFS